MKHIKIDDVDKGFDRINQEMQKLKGAELIVGVLEKDKQHPNSDLSFVDLAAVHEYGVKIQVTEKMRGWFAFQGYPLSSEKKEIHIPERSFIRSTVDKKKEEIVKRGNELLARVAIGRMKASTMMDKLGNYVVKKIRENIDEVSQPPLTQMTVEMRNGSGEASPLQDTGALWQSIDYKVSW